MEGVAAKGTQPQYNGRQSLIEERQRATFSARELGAYLEGGELNLQKKEMVMLEMERDEIWKISDYPDMSRDAIRERAMAKIPKLVKSLQDESMEDFLRRLSVVSIADPGLFTRFGVHFGLFFGAIRGQASPAQLSYWMSQGALSCDGIIGCFGMTELGHGSNVAGVETTATFDEATDEFVIHTPTLTGTKWWIGGAASTATHCAVYAQLIVKGKNYGSKPFIVQLRDRTTFATLKGITIGDLGAKMGRDAIDNGWIQFTNVRIPRSHMLMKYTKVSRKGVVTSPPLAQLSYGALIQGRVQMCEGTQSCLVLDPLKKSSQATDSANVAKKALAIAVRYACVRRQFGSSPKKPETKLMDYVIHQHRLLPLLATAFAIHFTSEEVRKLYMGLMERLDKLSPESKDTEAVLETLKETHATSAGLKAFGTWSTLNTIEQCRQTLGGHGYSKYSGLSVMYNDFAVQCTWEGDNTILTLQLGRYLLHAYKDALKGEKQTEGLSYLNRLKDNVPPCSATTVEAFADLDLIQLAYDQVSLALVRSCGEEFAALQSSGKSEEEAMEATSYSRLIAARNHCFGYLFRRFRSAVDKAPAGLKAVLGTILRLYGLYNIAENSGAFLASGFLSAAQLPLVRRKLLQLYEQLRPDAVTLVDSFYLSDWVINSPLGCYDGDIYEKFYREIKLANPPNRPHTYFEKLIKPMVCRPDLDNIELELDEAD